MERTLVKEECEFACGGLRLLRAQSCGCPVRNGATPLESDRCAAGGARRRASSILAYQSLLVLATVAVFAASWIIFGSRCNMLGREAGVKVKKLATRAWSVQLAHMANKATRRAELKEGEEESIFGSAHGRGW